MAYAQKIFGLWEEIVGKLKTNGYQPRKPAQMIGGSMLAAAICRLGSLNALEQTAKWKVWKKLVGEGLPSADAFSRTYSNLELGGS